MRSFNTDISNVSNSGTQLKRSVSQREQKEMSRQKRDGGREKDREAGVR